MLKKFSFVIYKFILIFDKILFFFTKKTFVIFLKDFFQENSYKSIKILNEELTFFVPNRLIDWRVDTFFDKEPETLEWIDSFEKDRNIIFWDIGANIGLYSLYNAIKNKNSKTISFEPSSSNLRTLSRNISLNNLQNKIQIFPMPLSNIKNKFMMMKEGRFIEGGAINTFGEDYNFEGKKFQSNMNYQTIGTSINFLIDSKILETPDYIKIDVDGIEHLILEGGDRYLIDNKIKSILIEINENFKDQYDYILNFMKKNNFKLLGKKQNKEFLNYSEKNPFKNIFNYIFVR